MTNLYTMYGAEFSLYSGKIRAYLRKKGIPFKEVSASLSVYNKFIMPRTGVRYIPVLQTPDDKVYQDTTVIIDALETRFPEHSVYPSGAKQKLVALLLELYGDEWLLIPAMHYRWHYKQQNAHFIYGEFGRMLTPKAPALIQRWLGKRVGNRFKNAVSLLGVTKKNRHAIEQSYEHFIDDLNRHFEIYDYLLGDKPCIADFGFMGPLYAHLFRDPAPSQLMHEKAPAVVAWIKRMNSDHPALQANSLLNNDEIPSTLLPILIRMAKEQLPVLVDTDKQLAQWRQQNPNQHQIKRFIGKHNFTVEGVTNQRVILPYSLWMFQRAIAHYQKSTHQQELDQLLKTIGFSDTLKIGLKNKLTRTHNVLHFDS